MSKQNFMCIYIKRDWKFSPISLIIKFDYFFKKLICECIFNCLSDTMLEDFTTRSVEGTIHKFNLHELAR